MLPFYMVHVLNLIPIIFYSLSNENRDEMQKQKNGAWYFRCEVPAFKRINARHPKCWAMCMPDKLFSWLSGTYSEITWLLTRLLHRLHVDGSPLYWREKCFYMLFLKGCIRNHDLFNPEKFQWMNTKKVTHLYSDFSSLPAYQCLGIY